MNIGDKVRVIGRSKMGPIRFVTDVSLDGDRAAVATKMGGKPQSSRWYPVLKLLRINAENDKEPSK